jgi:hypothetical protein
MSILNEALLYARLGLRVVRLYGVLPDGRCRCGHPACTHAGKHPNLGRGWQHQATGDPDTIRRWYSESPHSNLGVKTGLGILALDEDGDAGRQSLIALQKRYGPLPETARSRTRSGHHRLFKVPAGVYIPNSQGSIGPGLDIRGDGPGQIVAPPSRHWSGHTYQWEQHPAEGIADCPEWLLRLAVECQAKDRPRKGASEARRRAGDDEAGRRPSGAGQRAGRGKEGDPQAMCPAISWDNRHAALMQEITRRYPVNAGGNSRYGQMVRAVGSLLGRGVPDDEIGQIMSSWLEYFEPLYEHDREEAGSQLDRCIHSTINNPSFQRSSSQDHLTACKQIDLTPFQRQFLITECHSLHKRKREEEEEISIRLAESCTTRENVRVCMSRQELAFVEAWVVHCWHKLMDTDEETILATRDQIRAIIGDRHGLELDDRQFERLKRKYIGRDGCPATRLELLRQVVTGCPGVPSEYELVWLGWLFTEDPAWEEPIGPQGFAEEELDWPGPADAWWLDEL